MSTQAEKRPNSRSSVSPTGNTAIFNPKKRYGNSKDINNNKQNNKYDPDIGLPPNYSFQDNFKLPKIQNLDVLGDGMSQIIDKPINQKDLSIQEKLNQMLLKQIQQQQQSILKAPVQQIKNNIKKQNKLNLNIVERTNNNDFINEFQKIYYNQKDQEKPKKEQKFIPLNDKLQPHGMPLINFTLTEHLIEEKIQHATEQIVGKSQERIQAEINKKTDNLKKYMDKQLIKSSQVINNLQNDLQHTSQNVMQQIRKSQDDFVSMKDQFINQSGQWESHSDIVKSSNFLQNQIAVPFSIDGEQFILEIGDIKSIDVIDLNQLQNHSNQSQNNQKSVLDKINQIQEPNQQMSNQDKQFFKAIFDQINKSIDSKGPHYVPQKKNSQLQVNNFEKQFPQKVEAFQRYLQYMNFADKRDLRQKIIDAKKEKYIEFLDDESKFQDVGEKERVKALECMLKIMNHQLDTIKAETSYVIKKQQQFDKEVEIFNQEQNRDEYKIFRNFHEARLKRKKYEIESGLIYPDETDLDMLLEGCDQDQIAEIKAQSMNQEFQEQVQKRQQDFRMNDVAELIVENKLLIDKIDDFLNQKPSSDQILPYDQISSSQLLQSSSDFAQSFGISQSRRTFQQKNNLKDKIQEIDEFPDDMIDELYNQVVKDGKSSRRSISKKKQNKSKNIAPAYKNQSPIKTITKIGKKAQSRLFKYEDNQKLEKIEKDYLQQQEEKYKELKAKSVQQLRKAAEEKRKEMNDKIRQSVSREREAYLKNQSLKEKKAMVDTLKMEKNIRQEIGEAIKSINQVQKIAFQ